MLFGMLYCQLMCLQRTIAHFHFQIVEILNVEVKDLGI